MMVFVGAAVPGPTTRRRQITNTDTIPAIRDARMRSLHSGLGTGGIFRYVRGDACRTACPGSARLLAAGDYDARAIQGYTRAATAGPRCAAPLRPARSNPLCCNPSIIETDESTGR